MRAHLSRLCAVLLVCCAVVAATPRPAHAAYVAVLIDIQYQDRDGNTTKEITITTDPSTNQNGYVESSGPSTNPNASVTTTTTVWDSDTQSCQTTVMTTKLSMN